MRIVFLGTGTSQGIPVIGSTHPVCLSNDPKDTRLRVSVLVQWEGHNLVIDCGPDFRQQMLRNPIDSLDAILFTHEHSDHTAGLDDVRPFYFRQGDVPLFAHQRVLEALKRRYDYIFTDGDKYPGVPTLSTHAITKDRTFDVMGKQVVPIEAMHADLPILGFRLGGFTYLTDVKTISTTELKKLKGTEVLVINALRHESHRSHLNLNEALDIITEIQPKKAYLTHISALLGFHEEVSKTLPKNVFLAYDNLVVDL